MTRNEKIEALAKAIVDGWGLDDLVSYAVEKIEYEYDNNISEEVLELHCKEHGITS